MLWIGTIESGGLAPDDALVVSAADRGFTVGEGVFETLTVRAGSPFALERHLQRLLGSAGILGLPVPHLEVVRDGIRALLQADASRIGALGRLRITYTAGAHPGQPTLLITCVPLAPLPAVTTAITSRFVRNERSATVGAKTVAYVENLVALREASAVGATEAIMGNTQGRLCEGSASNVIVVIDGEPLTPSLASGCLPGVTRSLAIEWLGVREADLPLQVLETAGEILLTSATRGIQALARLDDRALAPARIGAELRSRFEARIALGDA
ncbi:MAG: aminotransferase class IV [Candidatus Nanopelagicales bacterium]|nr:aminotransferase class IV [Candidatus Nanopelagicales bacterium]